MTEQKETMVDWRLKQEIDSLNSDSRKRFQFYQDKHDKLIFYFKFEGAGGTDFEGGHYLAKLDLGLNYPYACGEAYILTPNGGRFVSDLPIELTCSFDGITIILYTIKNRMDSVISMFYDKRNKESEDILRRMHPEKAEEISCTASKIRELAKDSIRYNSEKYPEIWREFTI